MLNQHAAPGNPAFEQMRNALTGAWMQRGQHAADAVQHAGAQIYNIAQVQARLLAYVDVTWIMVFLLFIMIPLPFLMKRPKAGGPMSMGH
jgi:DHA2 family multidrug resistance protein